MYFCNALYAPGPHAVFVSDSGCLCSRNVDSFVHPSANSIMGIIITDTTWPIFVKIHMNIMALEATFSLYHGDHANRLEYFV
jgi:hypothetical protein